MTKTYSSTYGGTLSDEVVPSIPYKGVTNGGLVIVAVIEQLQLGHTSPGLDVIVGSEPTGHNAAMHGFS